jgi:hypothetical protein
VYTFLLLGHNFLCTKKAGRWQGCNLATGPNHNDERAFVIMATSEVITIPLYLPRGEAAALAKLACRLGLEDCARLAGPGATAGDQPEAGLMRDALLRLTGALAGVGYSPR